MNTKFLTKHVDNKISNFICSLSILIITISTNTYADPIDNLKPGHWLEIPNTNLSRVYPSPIPWGQTGPTAVMSAWSGGIYDTTRDRLIVWGGGHLDYAGNEMYAFNINTLTWSRLTEPSPNPVPCALYMPDGQPGSHHTYNMLQYTTLTDSLISVGGGGYGSGCDNTYFDTKSITTDKYDLTTNTWIRAAIQPSAGNTIGRVSAVDSATGHIWTHGTQGGGKLLEYDPAKNEWYTRSNEVYLAIGSTAAIEPIRRIMVTAGGYGGARQIKTWSLSQDDQYASIPNTTGDTLPEYSSGIGFTFDPTIEKFVAWIDGATVYTLDPATWIWTKIDAATTNTVIPSAEPNGTFGRFRYIPSKNAYILVNSTTSNVFFYKMNTLSPSSAPNTPAIPTTSKSRL